MTEKLPYYYFVHESKVMILSRNLHFIPNYNTTAINMKLVSTQVEEKDNSKPAVRRRTSTTKPIKKGAHFLVKWTGGDGKDKEYHLSTEFMYLIDLPIGK